MFDEKYLHTKNFSYFLTYPSIINKKYKHILIAIVAALFPFFDFIQMTIVNTISYPIMREFHLNSLAYGNLTAMYMYSSIIVIFPAGLILDRVSVKKTMLFMLALSITSTIVFGMASSYWVAALARLMAGVAGSFTYLSAFVLLSRWFAPERKAVGTSLIVFIAISGGIISQGLFGHLTLHYNWHMAIFTDVLIGLIIFTCIFTVIKDYPDEDYTKEFNNNSKKVALSLRIKILKNNIRSAVTNRTNWLIGLYISLLNVPIIIFGSAWGNLYLTQAKKITLNADSIIMTLLFVGMMLGALIWGYLSDKFQNRKLFMLIGSVFCLAISIYLIYFPIKGILEIKWLMSLIGFFSATQILGYTVIIEQNSPKIVGAAEGIAAELIVVVGSLSQPILGYILDNNWQGNIIDNVHYYSKTSYQHAFLLIPIAIGISIFMAIFAKTERPYSVKS